MQQTHWTEFFTPDASTDRGWLKALCDPYCWDNHLDYTSETMPVSDDEVPGGWREQSTLGNYLDYGPVRIGTYSAEDIARLWPDGLVHAVCYASKQSKYCRSVQEAKDWIEAESLRVRPNLAIQRGLALVAA